MGIGKSWPQGTAFQGTAFQVRENFYECHLAFYCFIIELNFSNFFYNYSHYLYKPPVFVLKRCALKRCNLFFIPA